MLGIGGTELVIILLFGFLIFGPDKLPQIGRTVGRAIRQFREASEAANQKFKDEVYDPFKEAVEPYADQIKEQSAPLKEDLDAINNTLNETKEIFTDPFGLKDNKTSDSKKSGSDGDAEGGEEKTPGIKSMVDDMLHDPFDIKKDQKAAEEASIQESLDKADEIIETVMSQPLPETGGKVKKGLAESLYDLDAPSAAEPAKAAADAVKEGE